MQGLRSDVEGGLSEQAAAELLRQKGVPKAAAGSWPKAPETAPGRREVALQRAGRKLEADQTASGGFTHLTARHPRRKPCNHRADLDDHRIDQHRRHRG